MIEAINFEWTDDHEITFEGRALDVHNDYDFASLDYSIAQRRLVLSWSANGFCHSDLTDFRMEFEDVHHLSFSPRDTEMPFSEDSCLEGFGYDDGTLDWNSFYPLDQQPEDHWYWAFVFHSGAKVLVGASKARLSPQYSAVET